MTGIYTRYNELLAKKEIRDGQKYRYMDVQDATGLSAVTVTRYAKNNVTRFDEKTVTKLCNFLGCELHEFLMPKVSTQAVAAS